MFRVILADDEGEFRHWLQSLLERSEDFRVVGQADTGRDALRMVAHLEPDLVIADVDMPQGDGLEVARHLRELSPGTRVILISGHLDPSYERLASQEGALAFISKARLSLEALRQALKEAG